MLDNELLKKHMQNKEYSKCITILKRKITSYVVSKVKFFDNSFDFTTISDLISASNFYLHDSSIARSLKFALTQENVLEQIDYLLKICQEYNIS